MSRETDAEARRRRLAEALRENLRRRKARGRTADRGAPDAARDGSGEAREAASGEGAARREDDEDEPEAGWTGSR